MPTYEYKCFDCGENQEFFQKMSDPAIESCPLCNSSNFRRLISATAFHLKGSGWYKTDYANGSGSDSAKKNGAGDAGAAKADSESKPKESGAGGESGSDKSSAATPSSSESTPKAASAAATNTGV